MAAEFDTEPNYTGEDETPPPPETPPRRDNRGIWGTLALMVLGIVLLVVLLAMFTARVPSVIGLNQDDARAKLARAGFSVGDVSEVPLGEGRPGHVTEQVPVAGMTARKGTTIDLMIIQGGNLGKVPDVLGQNAANATVRVQQAGFEISNSEEFSDTVPEGAVISQSPPGGALAQEGTIVSVAYSIGPQSAVEPNVDHTDTDDGLTDATRDSSGSGSDPLMMNCTRAYPSATAWSSGGDIYVRLTSGGAARRVTSTGDWDTDPVISPSHKYLVFMRANGQGQKAANIGAVCFTSMKTYMLSQLPITLGTDSERWFGKPVFAPSAGSTRPNTDWIVYSQYWRENYLGEESVPSARLIVCNVPMDSKWVSWNIQFRPAHTLQLLDSSRAGCVRVRQTDGSVVSYDRDFQPSTGLYLH